MITDGSGNTVTSEPATLHVGSSECTVTLIANGGYFNYDLSVTELSFVLQTGSLLFSIDEEYTIMWGGNEYVFAAWCTDADCSGDPIDYETYVVTTDITLYAKWTTAANLLLHANGGRIDFYGDGSVILDYYRRRDVLGAEFSNLESILVTNERTFLGWYYEPECVNLAVEPNGTIVVNQTELHLYAGWAPATGYTVTFDANAEYGGHLSNRTYDQMFFFVPEGRAIGFEVGVYTEDETKSFGGWNLVADGSGESVEVNSFVPTCDVTLYAQWINKIVVTFDANGSVFDDPVNGTTFQRMVEKGQRIYEEDCHAYLHAERKMVSGWYLDEACTQLIMSRSDGIYNYTPSVDVTLYAEWADYCVVTFDANGGYFRTFDGNMSISTDYVPIGGTMSGYPVPEIDSTYSFDGWYLDAECTGEEIDVFNYPLNEDMTFYAKWTESVLATFDANGGVFEELDGATTYTTAFARGGEVSADWWFTHNTIRREMVIGWYAEPECIHLLMSQNGRFGAPASCCITEDTTFYAKWSEYYTVTFNSNGGYIYEYPGVIETQIEVPINESLNWNPYMESQNGMVFYGWYLNPECTGEQIDPWDYIPTGDVTLYAKWGPGITVTFDGNGRAFENTESTTYIKMVAPGDVLWGDQWFIYNLDEGLMVSAWYDNPECDGEPVVAWDTLFYPEQDITLYACWSEYWTVTFDANGGCFYGNPGYTTHTTYNPKGYCLKNTPYLEEKNGLMGAGWYLNPECTGEQIYPGNYIPEGDVTLYAKWSEYWTVTFNGNGGYIYEYPGVIETQIEVPINESLNWNPYIESQNGMMFAGWYLNPECTGEQIDPWGYIPTSDVTLYAKWEPAIIVTFDGNGRAFENTGSTTYIKMIASGGVLWGDQWFIYNLDEGLMVSAWYDNPDCIGEPVLTWDGGFNPEQDITLYACWSEYWTVTFDANGGYFYGEPGYTTEERYVPKGYGLNGEPYVGEQNNMTFAGWYLNQECTGEQIDLENFVPTADVTLYAKWNNMLTVTFSFEGGHLYTGHEGTTWTCHVPEGTKVKDTEIPDPVNDEDNALLAENWYLTPECNGDPVDIETFAITEDVTFYAKWGLYRTITFYAMDGHFGPTPDFKIEVDHYMRCECIGQYYLEHSDSNMVFAGWHLDPECTIFVCMGNDGYEPTYNMTLYAKWVSDSNGSVTVTFDGNGRIFEETGSTTFTTTAALNDYIYGIEWFKVNHSEGVMVSAWYDNPECIGEPVLWGDNWFQITEDVTLYAKWSEYWTITFDANGGCFYGDPDVVLAYSYVPKGEENYWEPYCVNQNGLAYSGGWYRESECLHLVDPLCYVPTEDTTFYAKWVAGITVTFDANGGSFPEIGSTVYSAIIAPGYPVHGSYTAEYSPIGGGVSFIYNSLEGTMVSAWYDNPECTGEPVLTWDGMFYPTQDITLYANWSRYWTVTFNANGGCLYGNPYDVEEQYRVIDGEMLTSYPWTVDEEDIFFAGWYDNPECTGEQIDPTNYIPTGDVTLYAKWVPGFTVTFDGNGRIFEEIGSSAFTKNVAPYGIIIGYEMPVCNLNEGVMVSAWYNNPECAGTPVLPWDNGFQVMENTTLYACWSEYWTVAFDANGGYFGDPEENRTELRTYVPKGQQLLFSAHAENQDNMMFDGWYLDPAFSDGPVEPWGYVPTGNTTLYAKWTPIVGIPIDATTFPDSNFRNYIAANFDDGDDVLYNTEINAVMQISVRDMGIASLQGIEYFTELQFLDCGSNNLTVLDLSSNSALTCLDCDGNSITSLNVSGCTELDTIFCGNNQLSALDVSNNNRLENLHFNNNSGITSIDLSNKTALKQISAYATGLTSLDVSACSRVIQALENAVPSVAGDGHLDYELQVNGDEYVARIDPDLTIIGANPLMPSGNTVPIDATTFPDSNFRNYIAANFDDGDDILSVVEIATVRQIFVRDMGIASLQGIEYFTELQFLDCGSNNLTVLDLSSNSALTCLDCDGNSITSLNVSGCTELDTIFCGNNQLSALDVSNNNRLENLHFNNNSGITSIDLSNKTALKQISAYATGLTSLDVSACSRVIQALENAVPSVAGDGHLDYELQVNGDEYVARIDPNLTIIGANPLTAGYTVSFDANDGHLKGSNETTWSMLVSPGNELREEPEVENGDSVFAGWYLNPECTGEQIVPLEYVVTGDVVFYAKWERNESITVTYDANGRTFEHANNVATWAETVEPGNSIYGGRGLIYNFGEGLMVSAWYDNPNCSGEPVISHRDYYYPTEDITLYAKWSEYWTVTFEGNGGYLPGGEMQEQYYIPKGEALRQSKSMDYNEGIIFDGWYLNLECTGEQIDPYSFIPTSDVTLYAKWLENEPAEEQTVPADELPSETEIVSEEEEVSNEGTVPLTDECGDSAEKIVENEDGEPTEETIENEDRGSVGEPSENPEPEEEANLSDDLKSEEDDGQIEEIEDHPNKE